MQHRQLADSLATIPTVFAGLATTLPDSPAILAPGQIPLNFAGLYKQLEYVRDLFAEWDINPGDPVAVMLPKGPEMAVALAVLPVSAVVHPLDPNLRLESYENL